MTTTDTRQYFKRVKLNWLHPNPDQPRKHFDPIAIDELAASIDLNGLQQPITATEEGLIIAGERRWRACKRIGLSEVPCVIACGLSSNQVFNLSMIENVLRQDMTPGEEARGFRVLVDHHQATGLDFDASVKAVAAATGLSKIYVKDRIRLLKLPDSAMEQLESGQLSKHQAWWAVSMPTDGKMRLFLKLCEQGRCTTQEQITAVANQIKAGGFDAKPKTGTLFALENDPVVQQWNKDFQRTCESLTALYVQFSEGLAERMGEQSLGLNHQRIICAKDVCKKLDAEVHRCKASQAIRQATHD